MSTPTPQSQLQFPVKLVASKLAKDSWPSWYKADARDDESDSSGWRYHLEYQDRKSSFWVIRDPFAGAADAEGDLRWLLEDHAVKNPYWLKKASAVNEAIQEYGKTLYNQIRRPLEYVILGDSRLQRPRDILQGISICLLITGENSDHTIHALHWEALELQLDLDINIVRTVYPLTAQSEGVRGTTESINRHGVTASLGVPVGLVGEDEKMDIDTGDSNNEALLTDDRESESSSYSSTNANPPEFLPVGEVSTLRILFCTARSAAIPNADIEYRVIARTVHSALLSLIKSRHIQMDFVRPGTWESLQSALNSRPPGYYHLVHFDVHGKVTKKRAFIKLVSHEDPTELERRDAVELAHLLSERRVSLVILNACESAKSGSDLDTNLAAILVQNGVKCAIGMSFKLLISSASTLVPLLYEQILQNRGAIVLAVHRTRRALSRDSKRKGILGSVVSLPDAILPVLYQQVNQLETSPWPDLFPISESPSLARAATFPSSITGQDSPLLGRDLDLLRLENALTAQSHVVELVGVPGSGRTSFLHFVGSWWKSTGLVDNIIWQNEGDWLSDETVDMACKSQKLVATIKSQVDLHRILHESDRVSTSSTTTLISPLRRGLLILDDISVNLVALNSESKKTLSDILHDQEFFYVVLVTDMRSDCTIGALPVHLLPLSPSVATELLWNTLPEAAQATPQSSDHTWKLDMCAWLLDYNPAAIKLLFGDLETGIQDDSSLTTMLDSLLMTGTPEHTKRSLIRLYESRFMKRVVAIWEEVASDSRIAGLLFLCLGCSTLRIRQDPKYLVKAFLSSHLIADWRKPIDLDFDITNIELGAEILSQLQELSNMRMYGDLLSHCRAYYTSILIRLESEGLIWRAGEDYFQVHPLLRPCALPICLIDSGPESYQELTKIFREQYQMASEDWELGDLLVLWSAKSSVDVPRDSPRYMLSTDLGNCLNVLCQPLLNSGSDSQWLRGFPWMLFIHTIIYLCASIDSRDVQSIDIFVEALATTFLRKWNLSKLEWPEVLERLQDPGSDEHDFLASNPLLDPRIGPFTAALVPLLRMKRYLSTDAITQILAGEATELYNELMSSTSKPNFDEDPMMVELLRGKFFIVGYNTGVEATRLEYLNTQFHRMQENLKKHFSSGVFSKLSNAYRAGVTKGIEKICRKLQSPLPVTGLTTVAECSAWALERGLELNIEEGIREPMPQELDGLAFPIIGLDEPQFDQMDAISGFPPSENQELERIGKETTASQDNQMVHWLIYYAHQSLRADNLGEAATAFQKARLHLMKIHPQIFDKSLSMTVERSNAFSSFFLESTALWGLGKRTEGRGLLLEMRDLCGGHLNCALDRHELWDKYRSMDLLFDEFGAGKDAEAPRYLERIEWAIEFISIHFEHTEEVENSVSDFLRNAHNLNRRARSDEITKPRDASERVEHRIFSFLFGQHSRGLVSTYSTHLGQQSRQFLRTVFDRIEEMVGVKRVDVARLLERVQSLHDSTRSYWQEGGKVSPHIAEIYVEAAKVLFGNLEDCRGFVHLTESEGKPLRKYFPWEKPEINPAGGALKHPEFDLNCLAGALGTQGGFNFNQSTEEDDKLETNTQPLFATTATTSTAPRTTWTQSSLKSKLDRSKKSGRRAR